MDKTQFERYGNKRGTLVSHKIGEELVRSLRRRHLVVLCNIRMPILSQKKALELSWNTPRQVTPDLNRPQTGAKIVIVQTMLAAKWIEERTPMRLHICLRMVAQASSAVSP